MYYHIFAQRLFYTFTSIDWENGDNSFGLTKILGRIIFRAFMGCIYVLDDQGCRDNVQNHESMVLLKQETSCM